MVYNSRSNHSPLNWTNRPFSYTGLTAIPIIGNGSCFFNSILAGFSLTYINGITVDKKSGQQITVNRENYVSRFREDLANILSEKVDPTNPNGLTYYQSISRGQLPTISQNTGMSQYSLSNMQNEL